MDKGEETDGGEGGSEIADFEKGGKSWVGERSK